MNPDQKKQKLIEIYTLPKPVLQKILDECARDFPQELGFDDNGYYVTQTPTFDYYVTQTPVIISGFPYSFENRTEFKTFVETITDTENIRDAYAVLYQAWEKAPTELDATTPSKDQLQKLMEEAEIKEAQREVSKVKARTDTQRRLAYLEKARSQATSESEKEIFTAEIEALKQKQTAAPEAKTVKTSAGEAKQTLAEILRGVKTEESNTKTEAYINSIFKGKKIFVVPAEKPQKIKITTQEKIQLFNLAKAVATDPGTALRIFTQKIQEVVEKSPPEIKNAITPVIVARSARNLVESLKPFVVYPKPEDIPNEVQVTNPASPLVAISNPKDPKLERMIKDPEIRENFTNKVQAETLSLEAETFLNNSLVKPLFDESNNVAEILFPRQISRYEIAANQQEMTDDGIQLDPLEIYDDGKNILKIWNKLATKTATVEEAVSSAMSVVPTYTPVISFSIASQASSLITTVLPPSVGAITSFTTVTLPEYFTITSPLLTQGTIPFTTTQTATQTFFSEIVAISAPGPFVTTAATMLPESVGIAIPGTEGVLLGTTEAKEEIARRLAENVASRTAVSGSGQAAKLSINKALGNAVAKGASNIAARLGFAAASAKIGAMVGTGIMPVLGTIVGVVLGALFGKALEKIVQFIKRHKEDFKIIGIIALGAGVLTQSAGLVLAGTTIIVPGILAGGGLVGVGARIVILGKMVGKSLAVTIATPVIIIVIVLPIIVALILFIINSGAYLVPPSSTGYNFESPYIKVDKVAFPAGPFENTDLPLEIEYTITITAKKGTLTNIRFSDNCQVIKKGSPVDCPSIAKSIPKPPSSISPTTPYTFSYSVKYAAGKYEDSLIVNNFTVIADTAESKDAKGVGSASVKIGDPPEDCPTNAWPIEGQGGLNDVTQGPSTAVGCSHHNLDNAIDIGVNGETVVAVHSGVITVGDDSCVGKYVKISSTCGSTAFSTLYGHLGAISVSDGQTVAVGQALGINDNTGSCTTGSHLHFEFQTSGSIPVVQTPYLVRDIPIGCCTRTTCNP